MATPLSKPKPANLGIKALLVSLTLVAIGMAYLVSESPVSKSKLNRLRVGMTTNEVEEILGPPSYTLSPTPGPRLFWDYDGLRLLRVSFDEHHRYQAYFYD